MRSRMVHDRRIKQRSGPSPAKSARTGIVDSAAFLSLALAAATVLVFLPVVRFGFVNYDDGDYVDGNAHVQSGLLWTNIVWAFTTGHASNWHPLTWLSHMLDVQLFGTRVGAYHLVSVVFHALNSVLLFLLLRKMTGAHWPSGCVAALFALHPIHVESVAWISERKDVLSTFFLLLTLAAYVSYANSKIQRAGSEIQSSNSTVQRLRPWFWYLVALVFFALGLMSKPMLVTTPFLLLLLDYWPLGRMSASAGRSVAALKSQNAPVDRAAQPLAAASYGSLLFEKVPFVLLAGASCVITFLVQQRGGAVSTSLTFGARLANAVISYVRYIVKMLWPEHLSVLYPHPGQWPWWQVAAAGLLLVSITAAVVYFGRARRYLPVGWFWFVGSLVPVIGLVQVGIQSMADRYSYIPSIGFFILLAWGAKELLAAGVAGQRTGALAGTAAIAASAVLTVHQVQFWRDSEALFAHATQVTAKNYLAYNNLGFYFSKQGRIEEAMQNYRKSLEINPAYEDALNNMGYALAGLKRYPEALPYYEAALRVRRDQVEVHNNYGNALSELGRIDEAIAHYHFVLERNPDHADAHNNLGIALAMRGKLDEAVGHFREALRCKPDYASAHSNLGNALAAQQKFDEAMAEYEAALRLNPKDAQAQNNLANVLVQKGRVDDAIPHYEKALVLNADNPEAHFNLGMALAGKGRRSEARRHFAEALRLKPDYLEAKRQLESGP